MSNSIWGTIEMHCISCGYPYQEYLDLHKTNSMKQSPLSEKGYNALDYLFFVEVAESTRPTVNVLPLDAFDGR